MDRIKLYKGILICLEGMDCSGKSTLAKKLYEYLLSLGYDVVYTREPGGCDVGEDIRNVILKSRDIDMDGLTEAYLFAASRNEHLTKRVLPELEAGRIVIMDRYFYSSIAYQGSGRNIGIDKIYYLNKPLIDRCLPDLTLYLDITPEVLNERKARRTNMGDVNRLDLEAQSFLDRVWDGYNYCKSYDEVVTVDANKDIDTVFSSVLEIVSPILGDR